MRILLEHANIIVSENKDVIKDGYILYDEEKNNIIDVGKAFDHQARANDFDESIDIDQRWILPGLINGHVHMMRDGSAHPDALIKNQSMESITLHTLKNAQRHLELGVTTVRDLGATGFTTLATRDAINNHLFKGPTIYSCGTPLIMTGGHFRTGTEVDGEDEVRKGTRNLLKQGVD